MGHPSTPRQAASYGGAQSGLAVDIAVDGLRVPIEGIDNDRFGILLSEFTQESPHV
jgi:hypothetical protein